MKKYVWFLLAVGSLNFTACETSVTAEGTSDTNVSVEELENSTAATDQAETTTAIVDSTVVISADTTMEK